MSLVEFGKVTIAQTVSAWNCITIDDTMCIKFRSAEDMIMG